MAINTDNTNIWQGATTKDYLTLGLISGLQTLSTLKEKKKEKEKEERERILKQKEKEKEAILELMGKGATIPEELLSKYDITALKNIIVPSFSNIIDIPKIGLLSRWQRGEELTPEEKKFLGIYIDELPIEKERRTEEQKIRAEEREILKEQTKELETLKKRRNILEDWYRIALPMAKKQDISIEEYAINTGNTLNLADLRRLWKTPKIGITPSMKEWLKANGILVETTSQKQKPTIESKESKYSKIFK